MQLPVLGVVVVVGELHRGVTGAREVENRNAIGEGRPDVGGVAVPCGIAMGADHDAGIARKAICDRGTPCGGHYAHHRRRRGPLGTGRMGEKVGLPLGDHDVEGPSGGGLAGLEQVPGDGTGHDQPRHGLPGWSYALWILPRPRQAPGPERAEGPMRIDHGHQEPVAGRCPGLPLVARPARAGEFDREYSGQVEGGDSDGVDRPASQVGPGLFIPLDGAAGGPDVGDLAFVGVGRGLRGELRRGYLLPVGVRPRGLPPRWRRGGAPPPGGLQGVADQACGFRQHRAELVAGVEASSRGDQGQGVPTEVAGEASDLDGPVPPSTDRAGGTVLAMGRAPDEQPSPGLPPGLVPVEQPQGGA